MACIVRLCSFKSKFSGEFGRRNGQIGEHCSQAHIPMVSRSLKLPEPTRRCNIYYTEYNQFLSDTINMRIIYLYVTSFLRVNIIPPGFHHLCVQVLISWTTKTTIAIIILPMTLNHCQRPRRKVDISKQCLPVISARDCCLGHYALISVCFLYTTYTSNVHKTGLVFHFNYTPRCVIYGHIKEQLRSAPTQTPPYRPIQHICLLRSWELDSTAWCAMCALLQQGSVWILRAALYGTH